MVKKCICGGSWGDHSNFCGYCGRNLEFTFNVNIDEETARWLMGTMQNPFRDDETPEDFKNREIIWNALKAAGVSV